MPLISLAVLLLVTASAMAGDLDEIRTRGTLRVVVWKNNMPEMLSVAGSGSGFEKELLDGFATLERLKVEIVPVDTIDERIPALLADRADVVAGGVVATEARRKLIDFTGEVFPVRHIAASSKPGQAIRSIEQLRTVRVCTMKASSWADEVANAGVPPASVVLFASPEAMLQGLRTGQCQAVVMATAWAVVAQLRDPNLLLGVQMGPTVSMAFGVRKDHPMLLAKLDKYVANVRRTPTWSRLLVKYFGESGPEILRRSRE